MHKMVLKLAIVTALAAIVCARTPRQEHTAPAVSYAYFAAAAPATASDYAAAPATAPDYAAAPANARVAPPALYYTATPSPLQATTAPTVSYATPSNVKITASNGISYTTPVLTTYAAPVIKTIIGKTSAPGNYDLEYAFNEPQTDEVPHHGDVVQGTYATINPDGSKRTVPYSGEALNVLNAIVRKQPIATAKTTTSTVHLNSAVAKSEPPAVSYIVSPVAYKYVAATPDVDRIAVSVVSNGVATPSYKNRIPPAPVSDISFGFATQSFSNGETARGLVYDIAAPAHNYRYVSPPHFNSGAAPSLSYSYTASGLSNGAAAGAFLNAVPMLSNVVASPGFFNGVADSTASNAAASSTRHNVATAPAFEYSAHSNSAAAPSVSNGVTAPAFEYVAAAPVRNGYVAPVYSNSAPTISYGYAVPGISHSAFLNDATAPILSNGATAKSLGESTTGRIFNNGYVNPTLSNAPTVPVFNYRYDGPAALKARTAAPALSYGYTAAASTDPQSASPPLNSALRYNDEPSLANSKLDPSDYLSNTLYK